MSSLVYLTCCKYKNKLIELLRKPLKLIILLGFAVLLVINFSLSQNAPSGSRPLNEYRLIVLAFYLVCFIVESGKGYKGGSSMFSLADVNLLFTSPIKHAPIFFYGVLGRLTSSLFMGVAFIYQFALLRSLYPITVRDMLLAVFGYGAVAFLSQLAGIFLAIYKKGYYEYAVLSANKGEKDEGTGKAEVKVTKKHIGLKKGSGASAFFYRHMLENRRTKTSLLSPSSLFYLVIIGVYGFIFEGDFTLLFFFSCTVSFLPVLTGRWIKELTMPHLYLVPESPVKKLFFILLEMLPKIFTEGVLQCGLIAFICGLGFAAFVMMTVCRLSVSFVLVGSALLTARIFREREKNSILLALSIIPGIIFLIPSGIACVWTMSFGMGLVLGFCAMAAVNILVSALLIFASRNILKY